MISHRCGPNKQTDRKRLRENLVALAQTCAWLERPLIFSRSRWAPSERASGRAGQRANRHAGRESIEPLIRRRCRPGRARQCHARLALGGHTPWRARICIWPVVARGRSRNRKALARAAGLAPLIWRPAATGRPQLPNWRAPARTQWARAGCGRPPAAGRANGARNSARRAGPLFSGARRRRRGTTCGRRKVH